MVVGRPSCATYAGAELVNAWLIFKAKKRLLSRDFDDSVTLLSWGAPAPRVASMDPSGPVQRIARRDVKFFTAPGECVVKARGPVCNWAR